ncbi:MAG TPA: ABC transporter substrate-binding protein [Xanthobacteraceae bacterium]
MSDPFNYAPRRPRHHQENYSSDGNSSESHLSDSDPSAAGREWAQSEQTPMEWDRAYLLRALEPEIVRAPPPEPWSAGRLFSFASFILAAAFGVVIALSYSNTFTALLNKALGPGSGTASVVRDDASKVALQTGATNASFAPTSTAPPPVPPPVAPASQRATTDGPTRFAAIGNGLGSGPPVRGVTDSEIRFGMSAPFSGSAKELGDEMKLGVGTAFSLINDSGGIYGRKLQLVVADDGYEPTRTTETMKQLYDKDRVFGYIGNVGTPTAVVALPFALEHRSLFFGAFTGADLLRRDPPDRYVFNYRASYGEETNAVVRYLVRVRHVPMSQIAVFAQHDSYGDAGFNGVTRAIRELRGDDQAVMRMDYERNTIDVDDAVAQLRGHKPAIRAVVMVATYRSAAKFIEKTRPLYPNMIYTNVSFTGSTELAEELMLLGPRYANGVIVTQVVPAVDSYSSAVLKYKSALAKYYPGEEPDYVSFEGYVDASLLTEGLKRAGPIVDSEKVVDGLESLHNYDMGLGTHVGFSPTEHQASHKVWGTQLDDHGQYQPIDLE